MTTSSGIDQMMYYTKTTLHYTFHTSEAQVYMCTKYWLGHRQLFKDPTQVSSWTRYRLKWQFSTYNQTCLHTSEAQVYIHTKYWLGHRPLWKDPTQMLSWTRYRLKWQVFPNNQTCQISKTFIPWAIFSSPSRHFGFWWLWTTLSHWPITAQTVKFYL